MNNVAKNFKYILRCYIGYSPFLLRYIVGIIRRKRENIVSKNTDLVIEGFPRSANTFTVAAFRYITKDSIQISSHTHAIAQLSLSKKYSIPCVVVIRNPYDAILSFSIRRPDINLRLIISEYIKFHQQLLIYYDDCIVCTFEEIINNFNSVIKTVNTRFNYNFNLLPDFPSDTQKIFKIVDEMEKVDSGGKKIRHTHVARPIQSSEKEFLKRKKVSQMEQFSDQIIRAEKIYYKVLEVYKS